MAVVVPPPSVRGRDVSEPVGSRAKDSVELLLEGMGGPRPDRTKTMPQTAGEASAAYHAEHALHAGRTAQDEGMKVLVDTVRLPAAEGDDVPPRPSPDATFVLRARLAPRVVVAALAGLLVVLAIFASLDSWRSWHGWPHSPRPSETPAAGASAPVLAPTAAPLPASATAGTAELPAPPATASPQPSEPVAAPGVEAPPAAPAAVATRSRTRTRDKGTGDVGDFKTTF
jgi:hypothetical protein